jgi:hypothetical protein
MKKKYLAPHTETILVKLHFGYLAEQYGITNRTSMSARPEDSAAKNGMQSIDDFQWDKRNKNLWED